MPEVSVIIPVYNVEEWLPACLDSVLAQTLEDIEVICVNDCSPDGCAEILADYASCDSRIRIITLERNSGQGVARNTGFSASCGRYVYFLDSDDMVASKALEELVARADADELDGIFFDSEVVYDSPDLAKRYQSYPAAHKGAYSAYAMSGLELFEAFMAQRDWTCYVQRQLWRSDFLREQGIEFPTWASHEDEAFAFEALVAARRVAFVAEPYFLRRYRAGSVMTTKPTLKNFASYFQGFCHMGRFMQERGLESEAADRNLARIYDALVRQHAQLLADDVDVAAWFEGTDLLDAYIVFAKSQKAYLHHGLLGPLAQEAIEAANAVYVYGAGVIAGNVFESLVNQSRAIEGFLVSSMEGNPKAFKGHRVQALADVPCRPDALVVVSVTDGYRADVEQILDETGWKHVYSKS